MTCLFILMSVTIQFLASTIHSGKQIDAEFKTLIHLNTKYPVLNKLRYRKIKLLYFFSIHSGKTCFTLVLKNRAVEGIPNACRGEFLVSVPSFTNDDSIQRPWPSIRLSGTASSNTFSLAFMIRGPNKLLLLPIVVQIP